MPKVDVWGLSLGCIIGWGAFVMLGTTCWPVAGPAGSVIAMLISAARALIGEPGLIIMGVTGISAIVTSVIGFYRASARILTNMAEDHILPQGFEKPSVCFIFVMIVSILLSLFGRNVLCWVVDLSSFAAVVAFGCTSAAAYRTANDEQDRRMMALGVSDILASVMFGLARLIPYLSSIEAMDAESYMLLAL